MKNLKPESEVLWNLLQQFARTVGNRRDQVICYHELRNTRYVRVPSMFRPFTRRVTDWMVRLLSPSQPGPLFV